MTFREYVQLLSESIGLHQIPVVKHSTDIQHFLAEDAVHHQFVTLLIRNIYKKNHCGHLDAAINATKTIAHLRITRSKLLAEKNTDICRVSLMNQIYEYSNSLFSPELNRSASQKGEHLREKVKS